MNHQKTIDQLVALYKCSTYTHKVDNYLNEIKATDDEKLSIKKQALHKFHQYKTTQLIKRNQIGFYVSLGTSIAFLLYFFVYLPKQNIADYVRAISIAGSVLLCVSLYALLFFYNRKKIKTFPEDVSLDVNFENFFSLFALFAIIPAIIFYFTISYSIENGAEKTLVLTKVKTMATVVSGDYYQSQSIRRRMPDEAFITLKFRTKEKRSISKSIEITPAQFQYMYKGQKVPIIYSSTNPQNVKILNSTESLQQVYKTQERELLFSDLTSFLEIDNTEITKKLNTIAYGWTFDQNQQAWINAKRECLLKKEGNQIIFFPKKELTMLYDNYLRKSKIKNNTQVKTNTSLFDNEKFAVEKSSLRSNDQVLLYYLISKKE